MDADEVVRHLAQADQDNAEVTDAIQTFATRLAQLRIALIVGGFTSDEAFDLVSRYADGIMTSALASTLSSSEDE